MLSESGQQPLEHASDIREDWRRSGRTVDPSLIEQIVLRAFDVDRPTLRQRHRDRAPIAFARQVAIYVAHVHLGLTLKAAARLFDRDRTTGAHACRTVEDRRERPDVERRVAAVEEALDRWMLVSRTPEAGR